MTKDAHGIPEVSVILPFYNAGPGILRALEQLDALEGPRMEVILVDDGSTDESCHLAAEWAAGRPGVTLIRHGSNRGVAHARNTALAAAVADYVWLTDWDDAWNPQIVAKLHEAAVECGADVVVCRAVSFDFGSARRRRGFVEDVPPAASYGRDEVLELILRGRIQGYLWSKLFRRTLLGKNPFPVQRTHSDIVGVVQLIPRIGQLVIIDDVLYDYAIRAGSVVNSRHKEQLDAIDRRRAAVHEVVDAWDGDRRPCPRLVRVFDHRFWMLVKLNLAIKSGDRVTIQGARAEIGRVVSFGSAAGALRDAPLVASAVLAAKYAGLLYIGAYRVFKLGSTSRSSLLGLRKGSSHSRV